jgi:tetratricopeptide (TPR) repeat protein
VIMKLIRWFFSNIILIAIILAMSYSYVYWGRLTDKDTPAGETLAWLSEEFKSVEGLVAFLKVPDSDSQTSQPSEPVVSSVQNTFETAPVIERSDAPATFVTPEIEASLSQVNDEGVVADVSTQQGAADKQTTRELWIDARQSFHHRDFEKSISSYERLIAKTSNNYDAYGELGNVYFNRGEMKQAANSYFEAASILVKLGQTDRASSLLGMLYQMDSAKAEELRDLLSSAKS